MDVESAMLLLILRRHRRRQRRQQMMSKPSEKQFWVWQVFAKREQLGEFHTLVQEMRTSDRESFFKQVIFSLSYLLRDPFLKQYFEICFFSARLTPSNIHEEQIYSLCTISVSDLGGGLSLLQGEHLPNC